MTLEQQLDAVQRLFLDTAPIIYFVEKHPRYFFIVRPVFERMDAGTLVGVASPHHIGGVLDSSLPVGG